MKFHCDRCKTRYSIADERVRGKILKIRCKNCSAVITVKEGGQVAAPPIPAAAQPARPGAAAARAKPAIPGGASRPDGSAKPAAGAAVKSTAAPQTSQPVRMGTNAPTPAARPGAVAQARSSFPSRSTATGAQEVARGGASAKPSSALQGAFAQALRRQPEPGPADSVSNAPATLDAEWYVSEDGEQYGPYELRQAQDWVSSRRLDDELYCWSEGFDDWLPVEKVSHFRGLRSRAPAASAPGFANAYPGSTIDFGDEGQTVVDAPPDERSFQPREDTPIPLFAATMAQIAAEAPTAIEEDNPFAGALKRQGKNGTSGRGGASARRPEPAARPALPLPKPSTPARGNKQAAAPAQTPAPPHIPDRHDGNNDFEIGEASRVVKLPPMLGRNAGNASPAARANLPGVDSGLGRGTGTFQQYTNSGLPIIQGGGT
ncbi:MAG TPA: GYF domain-containing protein, partial [Kofleriaceae bacterium]|nr:GYF domain-containing protein [Kofleriaceae bacterium]